MQENLTAIRVVKAFVREDYEVKKCSEANTAFQQTAEQAFHCAAWNMPCFQAVMYVTILAILWFGGGLVRIGGMEVGALTGFLSYVLQILNSLMMISNVFLLFTRSQASAVRVMEVLHEPVTLVSDETASARITRGSIDFRHVFFQYSPDAEQPVLSDICLHIEAGQTIGILGGTGSAKTSLVQLIPRLYDVSAGELLIDGHNVKEFPLSHLRDTVGMVLQKNTLFSGSIWDNLRWGKEDATEQEMVHACQVACADAFIRQLPNGYDTQLGQGGGESLRRPETASLPSQNAVEASPNSNFG